MLVESDFCKEIAKETCTVTAVGGSGNISYRIEFSGTVDRIP